MSLLTKASARVPGEPGLKLVGGLEVVRGRAAGRDWWAEVGRSAGGQLVGPTPDSWPVQASYSCPVPQRYSPSAITAFIVQSIRNPDSGCSLRLGSRTSQIKEWLKDTLKVQGTTRTYTHKVLDIDFLY